MRYQQYKFKFYLNARHAIYINGNLGEMHPHTWEIILHVVKSKTQFVQFDVLEKTVEKFMEQYQNQYINEIPPFDVINPTLENCAHYFKDQLIDLLNHEGWIFLMMEISENPSRSYVISMIDEQEIGRDQALNTLTDFILDEIRHDGEENCEESEKNSKK